MGVLKWDCSFVNRETGLVLSVYVDDIKLAKASIWENQHHSLTTFTWVALKENVKLARILWKIPKYFRIQNFCQSFLKSYQFPGNRMRIFLHGLMIWNVMQRNVWKEIANWRIKRLTKLTKSRRHVWTTTKLKKKKLYQL